MNFQEAREWLVGGGLKCPSCDGSGKIPHLNYDWRTRCPTCDGKGRLFCGRAEHALAVYLTGLLAERNVPPQVMELSHIQTVRWGADRLDVEDMLEADREGAIPVLLSRLDAAVAGLKQAMEEEDDAWMRAAAVANAALMLAEAKGVRAE